MRKKTIQTDNPKVGQTAFWPHDQFPYVLSSEIDQVREHSKSFSATRYGRWFTVEISKYSDPYTKVPSEDKMVFLDQPDGELISTELKSLELEYRRECGKLHRKFLARAKKIAPFLEVVSVYNYGKRT